MDDERLGKFIWPSASEPAGTISSYRSGRRQAALYHCRFAYPRQSRPQHQSWPVPIRLPAELRYGTTPAHLQGILATGLDKRRRQHVPLSEDRETARKVATRRAPPWIVFRFDTAAMLADGGLFHVRENGVWLTQAVPPRFLTVAEQFSRADGQADH